MFGIDDALLGGVIAGGLGFLGQDETNEANMAMSREQMQFNRDEAEKNRQFNAGQSQLNRDFQLYSSATQYQRAVEDMKKSGLNPMLAYSQGGAGNLSGSQAQGTAAAYSSLPKIDNKVAAGLNLAMSQAQVSNLQKTNANIEADTALKNAQAAREVSSAGQLDAQRNVAIKQLDVMTEQIRQINQMAHTDYQRQLLLDVQRETENVKQRLMKAEISSTEAETDLRRIKEKAEQQLIQIRKPEEGFSSTTMGENNPVVKMLLQIVNVLGRSGR